MARSRGSPGRAGHPQERRAPLIRIEEHPSAGPAPKSEAEEIEERLNEEDRENSLWYGRRLARTPRSAEVGTANDWR